MQNSSETLEMRVLWRVMFLFVLFAIGMIVFSLFQFGISNGFDGVPIGSCQNGQGQNCVIDGDTFLYKGDLIRIADIDAPEINPSRCAFEMRLGHAARRRLRELLNGKIIQLVRIERDRDPYGRLLRIVLIGNRSIGNQLVSEGLARRWTGKQAPWC